MKNTKNLLVTAITLAIVLCSSVQITARTVNPNLSEQTKAYVKHQIDSLRTEYERNYDPKKPNPYFSNRNERDYNASLVLAEINAFESIYYGAKAYTQKEIDNVVKAYRAKVKPETYGLNASGF